jgi:hypothetical protein
MNERNRLKGKLFSKSKEKKVIRKGRVFLVCFLTKDSKGSLKPFKRGIEK